MLTKLEAKASRSVERAIADLLALWEARGKPPLSSVDFAGGASRLNLLATNMVLMSVTRTDQ